jgi:dynein heavy chain
VTLTASATTHHTPLRRETITNKSKAAAGLCEWAINIVKYYDVVSEVGQLLGIGTQLAGRLCRRCALAQVAAGEARRGSRLRPWRLPLPPPSLPTQVEPKRQELAEANAKLEQANVTLSAVQAKVAQLNEQVRHLASLAWLPASGSGTCPQQPAS